MAIEAPYSKYRRTNCILYIIILLVLGGWCVYDGYYNQKWIEDHTNPDGSPKAYLIVNRQAPYYIGPAVVLIGILWLMIRNKKIIADENGLAISKTEKIPYDSIQQIDKTYFDSKGFFIVHYKRPDGGNALLALSYKKYDNLKPVLELLISKIT